MGIRLIVLSPLEVTEIEICSGLLDYLGRLDLPGNSPSNMTVLETDTGGLVEHTKALERTILKELGKLLS